jgi:ElaB/YqjD/DUF883 family membrane-anchored ribosome-binding protein
MNDTTTIAAKERLVQDLKTVMSDLDALVSGGAKEASGEMRELQNKLRAKISLAQQKLLDAEHTVRYRVREAARSTDDYVHDNPWQSIGMAAAVGVLIGLLISRR